MKRGMAVRVHRHQEAQQDDRQKEDAFATELEAREGEAGQRIDAATQHDRDAGEPEGILQRVAEAARKEGLVGLKREVHRKQRHAGKKERRTRRPWHWA